MRNPLGNWSLQPVALGAVHGGNELDGSTPREGVLWGVIERAGRRREEIAKFTLTNMLAEIDRWTTAGVLLFQTELKPIKANLPPPTTSAADSASKT